MIVFVTTHSEFMPLAFQYQVSALDYIDKELPHTEFVQRVETALLYAVRQNSETIAESAFILHLVMLRYRCLLMISCILRHRHERIVSICIQKGENAIYRDFDGYFEARVSFLQCHRSF